MLADPVEVDEHRKTSKQLVRMSIVVGGELVGKEWHSNIIEVYSIEKWLARFFSTPMRRDIGRVGHLCFLRRTLFPTNPFMIFITRNSFFFCQIDHTPAIELPRWCPRSAFTSSVTPTMQNIHAVHLRRTLLSLAIASGDQVQHARF
ncbi:hypothetical protein SERLA73DRAFT_74007 [Serpula lacrymans var. lacrymans S7.3]|uniref:Uncharacterized protein n=2 Tax=Serpula lacrymans var. lacrymans TaxID=341189 RepID=F8PXF7_SERL3|nr:uncharacterized protein SERLADRAFT_438645 [Serpula lacrymans var. lacrymans S7.9]EGN99483.1 hypothetical protein SERLA73DRAFT_74007 [Serpula lacrymans var. lacrymans S7.3]EGO25038.1 hypothetical protein SERLADRAFT_438645 [Serpula lacrymans var. lacrymans S7.9]